MRILLITNDYPTDDQCYGAGYHTYYLAQSLQKKGHQITVISTSSYSENYRNAEGVHVHFVKKAWPKLFHFLTHKLHLGYIGVLEYLAFAKNIATLAKSLHKNSPFDIAEIPDCGGIGFFFLRLKSRPPVVLKIHSPIFFQQQFNDHRLSLPFEILKRINRRVLKFIELSCIKKADVLVSPSHDMAKTIHQFIPSRKIHIIPNGIDLNLFKKSTHSTSAKKNLRVLSVTRISRAKGVDLFLEIAIKTLQNLPNVEFQIIGRDTLIGAQNISYKDHLIKKYHLKKYADRITFSGYLSHREIVKALAEADVFAFTSRMENFPSAILESLACGLPTVAFKVGGIPEIIEDGISGLLVEPYSTDSFVTELTKLLKNAEKRQSLSAASLKRIQKFSLDKTVEETEKMYIKAIQK